MSTVESFNGQMRDEPLNETSFTSLDHACENIAVWVWEYNTQRPHSLLGYTPSAAFAAEGAASLRIYATQLLASPAPHG